MLTKAEEEVKLATAHFEVEPKMLRIFRINGATSRFNTDDRNVIGLLEINDLTPSLGIQPLYFGPSEKLGVKRHMVIVEITPEEYEMLEAGELELPKGWTIGNEIPVPPHKTNNY